MRNYTESHTLPIAAYACYSCDSNGSYFATINIDWIAVSIVCCGAGWVLHQHYQPEAGEIFQVIRPVAHAATAIARRISIDLARFLLIILGIVAELLLELSNAFSALFLKFQIWINKIVDKLRPIFDELMLCGDTVWHSRSANLVRQWSRALRNFLSNALFWGVLIGVLWLCLRPNSGDKDNENAHASLDVRRYVVPAWVIKARPENRPRDGSSSHYISENDWALLRDFHSYKSHDISAIPITSERHFADIPYYEQTSPV